ncbi:transposase [Nitrosopumilus sp.]|uniref:transposase n=1 Tax=Nitrosopumilus sp. TaxID=2024843 RepID=UPI0034A02A67
MFNERETLLKKYNSLENESDKADVKKQVDAMTEQIQAWHDERFDQAKYDEFVKAKKLLQTNLDVLKEGKGDLEAYEILPWVSRSFDYENNALDVRIDPKYFIEENIPDYLDDESIEQIVSVYADKGYDSKTIQNYLKSRDIIACIPQRNFKTRNNDSTDQNNYNKTRYVVERFFAWLKCGFHRTRIRYERNAENYLGLINIASFLMYCRVLK